MSAWSDHKYGLITDMEYKHALALEEWDDDPDEDDDEEEWLEDDDIEEL